MTRPAGWLQAHLITEGHVTEAGLTRTPRHRTCRTCGRRTLVAIDRNGFDARTWADPTTPLGELAAILRGRQTWELGVYGALCPRSHHAIADKPADRVDVHVEHRCGDPPPPAAPRPPAPAWRDDPTAPPPY